MARQLTLLDTPPAWRLSEATRTAGRKGIADARAKLRKARTNPAPTQPTTRRRTAA